MPDADDERAWPGGRSPSGYVTREYFSEAHARLRDELHAESRALDQKITQLQEQVDEWDSAERKKVNRRWTILLAVLTSFLAPLLVAVLILAATSSLGR